MAVLGRGLVFQQVLVTQTCTHNSKNITLTLQIFHPKNNKKMGENNVNKPHDERKTQRWGGGGGGRQNG